jgi:gamma-glutamyltranspeptidase/glutathione hydrolase
MRGAIAAGHPLTAEAGARVLAEGGNAVDACIAAAFVGAVAEGPLTGPAGGGFLFVAVPGSDPLVLDCFFASPSEPLGPMEEALVDFADSGTQMFHVGEGSVAVPGLVAGLEEAHGRFGSREWRDLVQPAVKLAQGGVEVDAPRAFLHGILAGILLRTEEGRRVFGDTGRVATEELAVTLAGIRDRGRDAIRDLVPELAEDLGAYEVIERTPLVRRIGGHRVLTTPPPSIGGEIVLEILDGLAGLDPWSLAAEAAVVGDAYVRGLAARPTGTTHISVVDADGRAAGLSTTLGSGSGVFRGGAQLNNMLGELDVIGLEERSPGDRLPSMMTPTLVLENDMPRLVLGSAGSVRLAGAIAQVAQRVLAGTPVDRAIDAPRIHVEGSTLHLEGGWPDDAIDELPGSVDVVRWESLNLYFGGVQAVERRPDGTLLAAGDPRRGGTGLVVS